MATAEQTVKQLLALADIQIGGNRPFDIKINDPKFYSHVLAGGSLALGESYMDGWWDCRALDEFFHKIIRAKLDKKVKGRMTLQVLKAKILNLQSKAKAYEVGEHHYDLDNDLYRRMLDKRMTYSCGYWKNAKTLDDAQEAKLDLICRKLGLKPGMKVLDIGCGWGSFIRYAAEKYGVTSVGVTVSKEQAALAKDTCKSLPIEIRLADYRTLNETFDHVVSVGMFEHVGYKNYREFMKVAHRCLKPHGLLLLHTIGGNTSKHFGDPWVDRYIFPNGMLPSVRQIADSSEGLFVLEDWHNFSVDYDTTLLQWHKNFVNAWGEIKHAYNKRFYRMWTYYLLSFAGSFRARKNQLWQVVLSKDGVEGGYDRIRP
ncbi:cyclopropane fatty acyl phospholipid synthase [Candidatus Woesearchaeota archaeon]|nr:cyclopropane fatty acyl phospholipid synthase [Candidatus Woesearchaeota archaeon]